MSTAIFTFPLVQKIIQFGILYRNVIFARFYMQFFERFSTEEKKLIIMAATWQHVQGRTFRDTIKESDVIP